MAQMDLLHIPTEDAMQNIYTLHTVSLYKLEDKQKPRTKLSMYPLNIHIVRPKTAFTKILAAYGFLKIGFKVLKQL